MAGPSAALKRDCAPATKRESVLEGATRVFLECGFGAASMDAIAAEAGVSKQTVYAHFGGKEALFEAIVRQRCDALMSPLANAEFDRADPEGVLNGVARQFLGAVLNPTNMRLFRTIVGESARFPKLAQAFYRAGPRLAADQLADYLSGLNSDRALAVPDPKTSAELFFSMMRNDLWVRSILSLAEDPGDGEIDRLAENATAAFLAAHAAPE